MFDQIEKLKQELTDKYVVVNTDIPELKRFDGHVGQVKTVNMSGRALVEFNAWNNIGWYDIDTHSLRVVPKPEPAAEGKKAEAPARAAAESGRRQAAGRRKEAFTFGDGPHARRRQGRRASQASGRQTRARESRDSETALPLPPAKSTADILAAARAAKAPAASRRNTCRCQAEAEHGRHFGGCPRQERRTR